jgi:hypothetical protein
LVGFVFPEESIAVHAVLALLISPNSSVVIFQRVRIRSRGLICRVWLSVWRIHIMAEANKFITSRTSIDNPFPKYRSVKYRVDHSLLQKAGKLNNQSDIVSRPYKPEQSSWRKPSSYSQHRRANSSAASCPMPEEGSQDLKMSYLSTWDKLLSTQERSQIMEKSGVEVLRVHLPAIINFEPSKFTALDPLFLPFEDIEVTTAQSREESKN